MEVKGEHRVEADPAHTWRHLNDPAALERCIDGCEHVEKSDQQHFHALIRTRIGPLKASFHADLVVVPSRPPHGYRLECQVRMGNRTVGRGSAAVALSDDDGATLITFVADVMLAGHLERLGAALLRKSIDREIDAFFERFRRELAVSRD